MTIVVSIVYPADPVGIVPGGIDTFIRGIIKYAPEDITFCMVGITTDPGERPVGRWSRCSLDGRDFNMFPVLAVTSAGMRGYLPLSVRFTLAVSLHRAAVNGDVLEFHRLEPALLFASDRRPRNVFIHQNMQELRNRKSDILWSRFPRLYYQLENWLMPRFCSVYVVREDAVAWYQQRFPHIADHFRFTPTWMDPDVFRMPSDSERSRARERLCREFSLQGNAQILLSLGRLDSQKDPVLLAQAVRQLLEKHPDACLIYVGDGVLRGQLLDFVARYGLENNIFFAGLRAAHEVAEMLWASDMFVLSSAYEGMPMCVLEALGSGVPVVTTDVGEVRRVVSSGVNGIIVHERTAASLAEAIGATIDNHSRFAGLSCIEAVASYTPARVLEPVYENYRRITIAG